MRRTSFAVLLALLAAGFVSGLAASPAAAASTCFGHKATVARAGAYYHLTSGDDVVVVPPLVAPPAVDGFRPSATEVAELPTVPLVTLP